MGGQMDRHDEANRHFSQLMKTCLKTQFQSNMKKGVENGVKYVNA
jgi:hypothetical protein